MKYPKQTILLLTLTIVLLSTVRTLGQDIEIVPVFHLENVIDIAASPLRDKFAIGYDDGTVSIWSVSDYQMLNTLQTDSQILRNTLVWSSDGSLVAVSTDEGVFVWDANSGLLLHTLDGHPVDPIDEIEINQDYDSRVENLSFSPMNQLLATSNRFDRAVLLWDALSGQIVQTLYTHEEDTIEAVEFSPNGEFIAARLMHSIKLWETETGELVQNLAVASDIIAFSSDSKLLASGFGRLTSEISIWELESGEQVDLLQVPLSVKNLSWLDDNKVVANTTSTILVTEGFTYVGAAIHEWNVESDDVRTYSLSPESPFNQELNSDEVLLGIGWGNPPDELLVWERTNNEIFRKPIILNIDTAIDEAFEEPLAFALSPEKLVLAVGTNLGSIMIVNLVTGQYETFHTGNADRIAQIIWLSDIVFVTLSADETMTLWSLSVH
jgi:WD40 repeat protein